MAKMSYWRFRNTLEALRNCRDWLHENAPEPPKPLYPLKHEYDAALKNVLQEVSMMLTMARTIAGNPDSMQKEGIRKMLAERIKALNLALYGEDAPL